MTETRGFEGSGKVCRRASTLLLHSLLPHLQGLRRFAILCWGCLTLFSTKWPPDAVSAVQRGGTVAVIASAKDIVNVIELLQGSGSFGAEEISKLEDALV